MEKEFSTKEAHIYYNTLLIHTDGSFTTGLDCFNSWKQK